MPEQIEAKARELHDRIDRQIAAHENAMTAEGGEVPYHAYDLLRECRDLLAAMAAQ